MMKLLANATAALSLLAGASVASPALSADKGHKANCPYAKHKKVKATATANKPQPPRGITLVEHRKVDVEILSFGP